VPARGQGAAIDPRWLAYLGCWEQIGVASPRCALSPTGDRSTVDLVTIAKEKVTARERIAATGLRVETTRGQLHRIAERCVVPPRPAPLPAC